MHSFLHQSPDLRPRAIAEDLTAPGVAGGGRRGRGGSGRGGYIQDSNRQCCACDVDGHIATNCSHSTYGSCPPSKGKSYSSRKERGWEGEPYGHP